MCCKNCHKWAKTLLDKLCPECFAQKHPDEDFDTEVERTLSTANSPEKPS